MKKSILTVLRDTKTNRSEFRRAAMRLSYLLAAEAGGVLHRESFLIRTPLAKTEGERFSNELVIIPILRAGLAMLPAFLEMFSDAAVGFFGMWRDEVTKKPHLYYENIPEIGQDCEVIVLDPMLATGGSGVVALDHLFARGVKDSQIVYVSIIAAPEGIEKIREFSPRVRLVIGQVDDSLNDDAFIVPGIGDFGDRFFT